MCISSSNWRSTRWMIHSCPHHRLLSVFRKMKSFLGKKKSNCTSTSSFNIFKLFFHSCWKLDVLRIGLKTRLKKEHANTFAHHEQLLRYFHAFFVVVYSHIGNILKKVFKIKDNEVSLRHLMFFSIRRLKYMKEFCQYSEKCSISGNSGHSSSWSYGRLHERSSAEPLSHSEKTGCCSPCHQPL